MKISVKTLDSLTRSFDVEPKTTIRELKEIISPDLSIPADKIRLIFRGNVLDDVKTVQAYGLEESTIHAVERLPRPAETTEPSVQQPSSGQQTASGTLPNHGFIPNELVHMIRGILRSVHSSFGEARLPQNGVSSRLETSQRFLDHVEALRMSNFQNNAAVSSFANQEENSITLGPENDFGRLAQQFRAVQNTLNSLQPVLNTFARFLEVAAGENSRTLIESQLYPILPDTVSTIMHSLAHSLHNLSDILVHSSSSAEPGENPFTLIVPNSSRTLLHSRGTRSPDLPNPRTSVAQSQSAIPESTTLQTPTSNPSNTVEDTNNNTGYHVTVQFLTDSIQDLPQFFIFNDRFPTATANSTFQVPRLIRSIAGSTTGAYNVRDASETPTTSQSSSESQPSVTIPNIIQTNQPTPNDPNLNCRSILSNNHLSTYVHLHSAQTQPTTVQPQPQSEPVVSQPAQEVPLPEQSESTTAAQTVAEPSPSVSTETPRSRWTDLFPSSAHSVIQSDVNSQKINRKMPPFSDGYLAGHPNKKKKMDDQQESRTFLEASVADSFIQSLGSLNDGSIDTEGLRMAIESDLPLQHEFRSVVDRSLAATINLHEEIDQEIYPECSRLRREH